MSFQQGLSGLNAASKSLDVIGNNIANANTVGFKGANTQFADVFASSADVFASSVGGAGGTSAGIGTKVTGVIQQFEQGNITTSSNPLDVAINGAGFFRVSDSGTILYSRNGQFRLDKDGFLVTATLAHLTGFAADSTGALDTSKPVDLQISSSGLPPKVSTKAEAAVNLDSTSTALSAAAFNLSQPATFQSSTAVAVYDSLGESHTLSMYFLKSAPNTWQVFSALDGVQVGASAVGQLTFQTDGKLDLTATTLPFSIAATIGTGASTPLNVDLDFTGSTQFGTPFGVNALAQDGFTSGRLTGFSFETGGEITARYTNGQSRALGKIALANFPDPQGLQPLGNNQWAESAFSGAPLVGVAGTGTLGVLQPSALEDSTVDLTRELVDMIVAQRFYQANAQTIKTQDQVLQTLVNLR